MTMQCNQEHEFHYLLKRDGNDFSAQVLQIPGIIIGGTTEENTVSKIMEATKNYLNSNNDVHSKAQQCKLSSTLKTSPYGIVLKIESFHVKC